MYGDGCKRDCGDHFRMNTNIKSLCCALETNTMLYVSYTSTYIKLGTWGLCGLLQESPPRDMDPLGWVWLLLCSVNWGSQKLSTITNVSPGSGMKLKPPNAMSRAALNFQVSFYKVPWHLGPRHQEVPSAKIHSATETYKYTAFSSTYESDVFWRQNFGVFGKVIQCCIMWHLRVACGTVPIIKF